MSSPFLEEVKYIYDSANSAAYNNVFCLTSGLWSFPVYRLGGAEERWQ